MYPPLTAEEAAGGPREASDNSALASCLDHLVRLETKHKEADTFKLQGVQVGGEWIRDLDYAITAERLARRRGRPR